MNQELKRKFNILCKWLEANNLLHCFYHALHNTRFPKRTNEGGYNMIWAIESSSPHDWHKAAQYTLSKNPTPDLENARCGILCRVADMYEV